MKNSNKKKWLILAHCFNMDGRAASQTITDKIPFLMKNGIEPVVISAPTGTKDKNFLHCQVMSPAPSGIIFEMRKIIEKKFQKRMLSQILKAIITIICFPFYLIEKIFINLDSHWSWFITASAKGIWVIKGHRPLLIYSTAGPSSTHLTGLILKKIFNIPWIAEIHDPLIPKSENAKKVYQRYAFHKWLEKKIVKNACAVIYFTDEASKNAKKRTKAGNNIHVLRPGAEPPDVSYVKYKKRNKMHFGHFGSLASDRNFSIFMEALSGVFIKEPHLKSKVVLDIYGTKLDSISKKAVKKFSLEDVVLEHGRLEFDPLTGKSGRQQIFEKMHTCDVLILIHGQTKTCDEYIPSKIYEYLLTQRPIAGIASQDSELVSILNSLEHQVVNPDNLKEIEAALENFIFKWTKGQLLESNHKSPFTVEHTVNKLMEIAKPCLLKQV